MTDMEKRIAGALFGVAVGDALGGPVEFMNPAAIAAEHGRVDRMIGGGWLRLRPGEITDDTQMTLCVARGIVEAPEAPIQAIGRQFIQWADSDPKDIGAACAGSIWNAKRIGGPEPTAEVWEAAGEATQAAQGRPVEGNGALMRTVYPGLFYDTDEAHTWASKIAHMTHAGPRSTEACELYASMVNLLTAPAGYPQGIQTPQEFLAQSCAAIPEDLEAAQSGSAAHVSGGYVVDSMRIAVACVAGTRSFKEAVVSAVNLGGDADTNAAITGGLAGAWYGYDAIPPEWIECLDTDIREELGGLAGRAYSRRRR